MEWIKMLLNGKGKQITLLLVALVLGVCILLVGSKEEKNEITADTLSEYKLALEGELEEICSSVKGVGKCKVSVSFSRGEEKSYKGSQLIETRPPEVLGVIVVCKGADSDGVRRALTELITSLYAIPSTRVAILKLN